MADPVLAPAGNFVEPAEPAIVTTVEGSGPPVDETEIYDSPDIENLPLKKSAEAVEEIIPDEKPPVQPEKGSEIEKPTTPDKSKEPTFETQQEPEAPFESKDAKELRAQTAPPILKGAAAKSFMEAKEKWAGIVEAKDSQLHKTQKEHREELALLVKKNEELEGKLSHLSGYESVIDFQASDKFKNDYEAPVKNAEQELIDFMKDSGATDEGIAELKEKIGDNKYLNAAMAELFKTNPGIASQFSIGVSKLRELRRKQNGALEEARANHGKLIEERRTETSKKTAQLESQIDESLKSHINAVGQDKTPQYPFLVKMRPPPGADQPTLDRVNQHNKFVDENIADLNKAIRNDDPKDRVRFAIGYMTAVLLNKRNSQLMEELTKANEYISRVKKASAPPDGGTGGGSPSKPAGDDPMAHFDSTFRT